MTGEPMRTARGRGQELIAQVVGCRMVEGACVVHQPRQWEVRRPGCPYVASLLRSTRNNALRPLTAGQAA